MFNEYDNGDVSLNDHSIDIQVRHNVKLKTQSLDERFNENSVEFVKELLSEAVQNQIPADMRIACLSHFTSVDIKDSTRYQIPESLKEFYAGSGGAGSEAGVSVQFEFDIKTGNISVIKPTEAKRTDTTDARESVKDVKEGSLIIRDLGYFSTGVFNDQVFQDTSTRGKAYFLSRVRPGINIINL